MTYLWVSVFSQYNHTSDIIIFESLTAIDNEQILLDVNINKHTVTLEP